MSHNIEKPTKLLEQKRERLSATLSLIVGKVLSLVSITISKALLISAVYRMLGDEPSQTIASTSRLAYCQSSAVFGFRVENSKLAVYCNQEGSPNFGGFGRWILSHLSTKSRAQTGGHVVVDWCIWNPMSRRAFNHVGPLSRIEYQLSNKALRRAAQL